MAPKPKAKKKPAPAVKKPATTSTGKSHTKEHRIYAGRAQSGRILPGPAARKNAATTTGSPVMSSKTADDKAKARAARQSPAASDRAHPGFAAVQGRIAASEGVSKKAAGAILAASTRGSSKAARTQNPSLDRVKGY